MVRPTLETVARAAGVSRQTVSNVLNAPDRVATGTRDRVHSAIDRLGYRPSLAARQLRTRRSTTLAMRMEPARDGINGVVLDRFLHAVADSAQDAGYRVLLYTAGDDQREIAEFSELLSTSGIDGVVLTSTHHGDPRTAWLTEHRVPFSTFGRPWGTETAAHPWVDVDGAAGTRRAVDHLAGRGHRRIGFLGWPAGSGVGDDRREGWRQGLAAAGLTASPAWDLAVPDGTAEGTEATARLLAVTDPPTAMVCASDSLALGALVALERGGAREALAVVGFDDTPVAAAVGLTSVAQPLAETAHACVAQVLEAVTGTGPATQHVLLEPALVERDSTATPCSP